MYVHVFPQFISCSFLQVKAEVSMILFVFWACGQLTFNLGVQVVYYNLELSHCHVSQVCGLQAPFH